MKLKFYFICALVFYANISGPKSQAQINTPSTPESLDEAVDTIKTIPSLKEACKTLNHKLLLNVDLIYYFENCSLHLITDPALLNILILNHGKTPLKMSTEVYAALPLGSNYTYENYYAEFPKKQSKFSPSACQKYNKSIVSENDYSYFYVEDCKKRKFENYKTVQQFNTLNNPIRAITNYELSLFPNDKPIAFDNKFKDIKAISETSLQEKLPNKYVLCKNINNKVAAFYASFFYVEKCTLLPIKSLSVALQMEIEKHGGVQDLSVEQVLGLEEGKEMSEKELMKRMR